EAVRRAGVPDSPHRVTHHARDVDVRGRRDLAGNDHEAGGCERLARNPALRVLLQHRVEHGVADLVAHLVGMAFGDRLRREDEALRHQRSPVRPSSAVTLSRITPATPALVRKGTSTMLPAASSSVTRFVSTSKPASGSPTSLATMRSKRFADSLRRAFST